ncbi:amidohydrolase [Bacillus gobiensis]|uniref:amidohydrolase n=1 Tax=Bacillus gobiensis TaxID=1441095 RepID=UPI003D1E8B76
MYADVVMYNGSIVSMDKNKREYEALAAKNGRIIGLGTKKDMEKWLGDQTVSIDLEGKTVLPGFIDAHQHMVNFGFYLSQVNCNVDSIKDLVNAVKEKAATLNKDDWVIGIGFNEEKLQEKRIPTAADFAEISNPVYILRNCLHTAVVNQTTLQLAGINENTSDVAGGEIVRDMNGRPTGILKEKAADIVKSILPPFTLDEIKDAITFADREYTSLGITGVHEAGMGFFTNSMNEFRAFQEMSIDRSLNVRVYGMILDSFFEAANELKLTTGFGNDKLKIGSIKMFSDGTLNGRTAAVSEEYLNPAGERGAMVISTEELEKKVLDYHREGFQVAIHAIGDRAILQVIAAYEKALNAFPRANHRHRIEHTSVTTPEIIERLSELKLIPVPQPSFLNAAGDVYNKVLQPKVTERLKPLKTFFERGIKAAGSSDCPVVTSSPLYGMYCAMKRETLKGTVLSPKERLSLEEALQMYTVNAAYAAFAEHEQGTLEIGKFADAVVLPKGFMSFSAEEVRDTAVEMTIIGGEIIYKKERAKILH